MIQIFYMKKEIKKLLLLTKSCGEVKKQFLQLQKLIEHDAELQAPTRFVEAEQREREREAFSTRGREMLLFSILSPTIDT